ncbi:hypothetical protein LR48_Vigan07g230100 [Vigna angularis]|uniref:DUF8039 domain-containing protein n=1 Tax=Phaseolus angularis TaxID=3914 RepID=A0A0L9V170_PHAAN|nr:hypothetical protein LR48_Vigan07g230100 [Vigna angularis]
MTEAPHSLGDEVPTSRPNRGGTSLRQLILRRNAGERTPVIIDVVTRVASGPNSDVFRSSLGVLARDRISILTSSFDHVMEAASLFKNEQLLGLEVAAELENTDAVGGAQKVFDELSGAVLECVGRGSSSDGLPRGKEARDKCAKKAQMKRNVPSKLLDILAMYMKLYKKCAGEAIQLATFPKGVAITMYLRLIGILSGKIYWTPWLSRAPKVDSHKKVVRIFLPQLLDDLSTQDGSLSIMATRDDNGLGRARVVPTRNPTRRIKSYPLPTEYPFKKYLRKRQRKLLSCRCTRDDMDDTCSYQLYILSPTETMLVARGIVYEAATIVHGVELAEDEVKVTVDEVVVLDVLLPVPIEEFFAVAYTFQSFAAWPRHLVGVVSDPPTGQERSPTPKKTHLSEHDPLGTLDELVNIIADTPMIVP